MDGRLLAIVTIICLATCFHSLETCPTECVCESSDGVTSVSCADQSLHSIPDGIPQNAQRLDLHGNQLSSLTDVFQNFTQLQWLDVRGNNLKMVTMQDVRSSPLQLKYFNMADNGISGISDGVLNVFENLEVLDLSENLLESVNSATFDGLSQLEKLDLSKNRIQFFNISESVFSTAPSLTTLNLAENLIDQLHDDVFKNTTSLHHLNLAANQIHVVDGHVLEPVVKLQFLNVSKNVIHSVINLNLPQLEMFDLSWNNVSSLTKDMFKNLENLKVLILDGNNVVTILEAVFEHLNHLETLSLSYMPQMSYISKKTFIGLNHLKVLTLRNNPRLSFIHKELFVPLLLLTVMDLSNNQITSLHNTTLQTLSHLSALDIRGNQLTCDCEIAWVLEDSASNDSIILDKDTLTCVMPYSNVTVALTSTTLDRLYCGDLKIVNYSQDSAFKIGSSAILKCEADGQPSPEVTWITPRKRVLKFHNYHQLATLEYLPHVNKTALEVYHALHEWHEQPSYYSESETREDRIVVLADGSLYIDYVMRTDAGSYHCIARNPQNQTEVVIHVALDYQIVYEVQVWTLIVGFGCAGSFFLLNLIYSVTMAGIRRCISKQRRKRIRQVMESVDQYKTARLAKIKDNYNEQVGKIRDQYHYQLGRLREHHQNQANRLKGMRDGASHKVDKLKENYNNQLGRLKEYSSSQLLQIREKYNNQIDKIKDYGNVKMERIHRKYKLKQQHVSKVLEMMNIENCRTTFETECVRTESMILHSDIFTTDVPINSPLDSLSISDDEYLTATSSEHSRYTSRDNVNSDRTFNHPINPYIPDDKEGDDKDEDKDKKGKMEEASSLKSDKKDSQASDGDLDEFDLGIPFKGQPGNDKINNAFHAEPSTSKRSHKRKHHRKKHRHSGKGQMWRKSDPVLSTFSDEEDDFNVLLAQSERPRSLGDKMDVHKTGSQPQQKQQTKQQAGRADNQGQTTIVIPETAGCIIVTETNL